jgi:hypothetical protein
MQIGRGSAALSLPPLRSANQRRRQLSPQKRVRTILPKPQITTGACYSSGEFSVAPFL